MTADPDFSGLSERETAALIYRVADELSTRGTREAFAELLHVVAYVGERVGVAARTLAASNSWSQVAEVAGTSKQAHGSGGVPSGRSRAGAVPARARCESLCARK